MNPAEATQLVTAFSFLLGLLGIPTYMQRKKAKNDSEKAKELTHASVANMLREDRDGLLERIKESQQSNDRQIATLTQRYEQQIKALRDDYEETLEQSRERIKQLEEEINGLYRRLYNQGKHANIDPFTNP